jgi:hypothetical protein
MSNPSTLVFCTSYVADAHAWESRYRRWLRHHMAVPWTHALICLIDDASPFWPPAVEVASLRIGQPLPPSPPRPLMLHFDERLGRTGVTHYPGWWRSFLHSVQVARHYGCAKIVHIESDAFVLSRRMHDFIESRQQGWTAFWCPRWQFPETAIQVICADQFDAMERIAAGGWERLAGREAERVLPFTDVVREPHGNRYGERRHRIPGFADFAVQVLPQHAVWFR